MPRDRAIGSVTANTCRTSETPALVIHPLRAVEHEVIAVADGARGHRRGVAAGRGLGQAVGEHRLALGHRRQVATLEVLGAGQQQGHRAELVHGRDQRRGRTGPGHLLDDDRGGQVRPRRPPPYSTGTCGAWKSRQRRASYEACGNSLRSSAAAAFGATFASHTLAHRRPDRVVLLGELIDVEVGHGRHLPLTATCPRRRGTAGRPATGRRATGNPPAEPEAYSPVT